jgi:hypothetical protein
MEPNSSNSSNFELPPLQPGAERQQMPGVEHGMPSAPERAPGNGEQPGSSAPMPVAPVSQTPAAAAMAAPPMPAPPAAYPSAGPSQAADIDLIEREWVEKAKEIVERTRSDPHTQNKEINTFKAEYLKKRYNKDMKLAE